MQKRATELFLGLLFFSQCAFLVSAEISSKNKSGAWILVNIIDDNATSMKNNNIFTNKITFNRGSMSAGWSCISGSAKGEALTVGFTWDTPPKIIQAGELLQIKVSVAPKANRKPTLPGMISAFVYFDAPGLEPGKTTSKVVSFFDSKGGSSSKCTSAGGKQMSNIDVVVTGKAFGAAKQGEKMSLYYGVYGWGFGSEYVYEWQ